MKILVTGFDPFGDEVINSAFEAVKRLPETIAGAEIIKKEIPTVFYRSVEELKAAIAQHNPKVVLCVGQAGGRASIAVEKIAINLDETNIPDNDGQQLSDHSIIENGVAAYFAALPVKEIIKAINEKGIPAYASYSAGTYVCNHIMYQLLYLIDKERPHMLGGFIHVPYDISQTVGKPYTASMPISTTAMALEAALEAIVHCLSDS